MRATKTLHNSDLAQLVEQMTVNHWVAGSSPAVGAISDKGSHICGPLLFLQVPFLAPNLAGITRYPSLKALIVCPKKVP